MKRPILNEVSLSDTMDALVNGVPSVIFTMSQGQWDTLLQLAYDEGHTLIELNENEAPMKAYRRKPQ